jgi:hypothetical protein
MQDQLRTRGLECTVNIPEKGIERVVFHPRCVGLRTGLPLGKDMSSETLLSGREMTYECIDDRPCTECDEKY